MKNKKRLYIIILLVGIALFSIGGFLFKTQRTMAASFVLIGIGSGLFGMSVGELIKLNILKKNPDYKLKIEIEDSDERNVFIKNKAKAKAFDLMITVYGILMFIYAFNVPRYNSCFAPSWRLFTRMGNLFCVFY